MLLGQWASTGRQDCFKRRYQSSHLNATGLLGFFESRQDCPSVHIVTLPTGSSRKEEILGGVLPTSEGVCWQGVLQPRSQKAKKARWRSFPHSSHDVLFAMLWCFFAFSSSRTQKKSSEISSKRHPCDNLYWSSALTVSE